MNGLSRIFKATRASIILVIVISIGMLTYSVLWMKPRAERAQMKFQESVTVGMNAQAINAIALKVGADNYYVYDLKPPENIATKVAVVSFYRFPGGLSANVCRVYFKDDTAILIKFSYRG